MAKFKLRAFVGPFLLLICFFLTSRAENNAPDYFTDALDAPLRGVELQYFRVTPAKWDMMLTRMAQYHADTVSTYVHWGFHEYKEGKFDFTGKTAPL
jgi:beta-galactosidase GanA